MRDADNNTKQQLAQEIYSACTEVGFFYIKNHGVSQHAIDNLFTTSREFFALDQQKKMEIDISHSSFSRGYIPMCGEKNNQHSKGDLKETFDMAIEVDNDDPDFLSGNPLYGPNQWPQSFPQFKTTMNEHFARITELCAHIYQAFALSLNLPQDYFKGMTDKPLDILRLLRYPPQPKVEDEDQIGTGAHSDFDCFTVLCQDPTGGLQVINSAGEWIDAPPIEGTFLINVGDMMERWTNGLFVSTIHRVINKSNTERYSTVFFAAPNYHTQVECLPGCLSKDNPAKYPPISAGEYIVSRYEAVLV
jgi:isopenicillin N synthase-like dioxygenase